MITYRPLFFQQLDTSNRILLFLYNIKFITAVVLRLVAYFPECNGLLRLHFLPPRDENWSGKEVLFV